MLSKVLAGTTIGLEGVLVEVEVDVAERGFPTFTIVGLPNKAIDEAKDRVRTAIQNAGYEMPDSRITVNLAPADIPKAGSSFDLAIAVGILTSSGVIPKEALKNKMIIGELSLEGQVRKVNGIIPLVFLAKEKNIKELFVPAENSFEAAVISGISVYPVASLSQFVQHVLDNEALSAQVKKQWDGQSETVSVSDFRDIRGQEHAKRALEIAAAGFHNVHLTGPPGAGKTLLSRSFPSILPPMEEEEILEVARIYSVVGMLTEEPFYGIRPFRSPHHTTSRVGLIGGGSHPSPGEISLAHRGVLFLDEFPEFPRSVLEALRQPLEDGLVTVSRASGSLTFPADFLLLAASNPCPCGFLGHPSKDCSCAPGIVSRYKKRLSGPLLDRIDIHVTVPPVEVDKLGEEFESEPSDAVRKRVMKAREQQKERFQNTKLNFNSQMKSADVRKYTHLSKEAESLLKQAIDRLFFSARSYFKIIKVAQTIADLDSKDKIEAHHIAEALQYR